MKKYISYLLIFLLLVSNSPVLVFADDYNATLSVTDVRGAAGEQVNMTVSLSHGSGIEYGVVDFTISYDSSDLTLVSVNAGSAFSEYQSNDAVGFSLDIDGNNVMILPTGGESNISDEGEIAVLTFLISENASQSSYTVDLEENDPFETGAFYLADVDLAVISTEILSGTITIGAGGSGSGNSQPVAGGGKTTGNIEYAWSYGGSITEENGTFTITPYTAAGYNYVIDSVYVDGAAVELTDAEKTSGKTISNATSSVFASFAYTLNPNNPLNGTLSVKRGSESLTSGSIVRGGDVLTITTTPSTGYELDVLTVEGLTRNADGTYTVTAVNGDKTPAITATFKSAVAQLATPTFSPASGTELATTDTVTISTTESGATIYYTTDGSTPTTSSTQYSSPFTLSGDATVKAIAVKDGMTDSAVATASYTVKKVATPTFEPASGTARKPNGTVAISTTETGATIYYTTDGTDPATSGTTATYSAPVAITAQTTIKAVAVKEGYLNSEVATATYPLATTYRLGFQSTIANGTVVITSDGQALTSSGSANPTPLQVYPGDTFTIAITPASGYQLSRFSMSFGGWESGSAPAASNLPKPDTSALLTAIKDNTAITMTFTMPEANVSVNVAFDAATTYSGGDGYSVTAEKGANAASDSTSTSVENGVSIVDRLTISTDGNNVAENISVKTPDGETISVVGGTTLEVPVGSTDLAVTVTEAREVTSISTEEDLRAFASGVNAGIDYTGKTVTLENGVTLTGTWTPIGTLEHPFSGTFDGGGYMIDGLSVTVTNRNISSAVYAGLFGFVDGATIKNATVRGKVTAATYDESANQVYSLDVGGIAGYARNANTFSNCISLVDISTDGLRGGMGGIVGEVYTRTGRSTFTDCLNYGNLTVTENVQGGATGSGGIVGYAHNVDISKCGNYGNITTAVQVTHNDSSVSGGDYYYAQGCQGGILGGMNSSSGTEIVKIECCFNLGTISGAGQQMGGIAGLCLYIKDCYNRSDVTGNTTDNLAGSYPLEGGIVGQGYTVENCYSIGNVTSTASKKSLGPIMGYSFQNANYEAKTPVNCKTKDDTFTASDLSTAFKADANNINGGYPLLEWQSDTVGNETYPVTFKVTPDTAAITVYSDAAMEQEVSKGTSGYELKAGTYYYKAQASGYVTETGSFTVSIAAVNVTVTMKQSSKVTFNVTPAAATLTVSSGATPVTPDSHSGGTYVYTLYTGTTYTYTATATGYNGVTREYPVSGDATVPVTLTASSQGKAETGKVITPDNAPYTISDGGSYDLTAGDYKTGYIYINTKSPVTLIGSGIASSSMSEDLHIVCQMSGVSLTLRDVYISNEDGKANMIDFQGSGNTLNFSGTSILDQNSNASGYAMIHVPDSASLTVTGGTAYLYKREQGAGIGGNGGANRGEGQAAETNGTINISGATIFGKNSKQGALIGAGAQAGSQRPGDISITDSTLYLIAISRGGAIGGSAGSGGASSGSNVYVSNSQITINIDWSGAAIGGGGYDGGNDSKGGTLTYDSGSIRTFIDYNATYGDNGTSLWSSYGVGVGEFGVNKNAAITADVVNSSGQPLYFLAFNTEQVSGRSFTVKDGDKTIYSGGLHQYAYINEALQKNSQIPINYTLDNWTSLNDTNLYLYLTGENHTLDVNGTRFTVTWNASDKSFTVRNASGQVVNPGSDGGAGGGGGAITPVTPTEPKTETKTETTKDESGNNVTTTTDTTTDAKGDVYTNATSVITDDAGNVIGSGTAESSSVTEADGATVDKSSESSTTTVTNDDGSVTTTDKAASSETVKEADGSSTETSTESSVATTTSTVTNADGSVTDTSKTSGTETVKETATDASGRSTTTETVTTVEGTAKTDTVANNDGTTTATTTGTTTETAVTKVTDANGRTTETTTVTETKVEETATLDKDGNGTKSATETATVKDERGTVLSTAVTESTTEITTETTGTQTAVEVATTTTTAADGSITVETTVTTESTMANGTTGTTVADESGNTISAEATVSAEAVESAAKTGEPVEVPITVTPVPMDDRGRGPVVELRMPHVATEHVREMPRVEIQVARTGPGIVAFARDRKGNLTPIKETRMGSVIVPVDGNYEIVIVDNTRSFSDVAATSWYADNVTFVTARQIFNGDSETTFSPENTMNRAMVAQVIYNYDRDSVAGNGAVFSDVTASDWYNAAIGWASENGIVNGYGDAYGALDPVTRQDLVTILYRYAKDAGYDVSTTASLSSFPDAASVSDYAKDAVQWAVKLGLINGMDDGTLNPGGYATRAQVAAIMQRFVSNVK